MPLFKLTEPALANAMYEKFQADDTEADFGIILDVDPRYDVDTGEIVEVIVSYMWP